mmetsp:Transcript_9690/g.13236  ORF Transcript_9690/g.13236 Transcript_9690/m.13236 type:complete len:94 (+) Transcript_9690:532-813(+)
MMSAFERMSRPLDKRFNDHNECAICLSDFVAGEKVSPLPCDKRHYFHTECIKEWAAQKVYCPLCNAKFTPTQLVQFHERFSQDFRQSMFQSKD